MQPLPLVTFFFFCFNMKNKDACSIAYSNFTINSEKKNDASNNGNELTNLNFCAFATHYKRNADIICC